MTKIRKKQRREASAEQVPSAATSIVSETHKESNANACSILPAPPLSRSYAYVIDWILGGIVSGLPAVLVYLALTHRNEMFTDLYVFEAMGYPWSVGIVVGLLCVLAAIAYFVLIPLLVWPGQTPGKRIAHVRVATLDGSLPSVGRLIWRQVIVGFLLEGSGAHRSR